FVLRGWISSTHPYRVAEIEEFDDDPTDAAEVGTLAADVRDGFGRLARALGVLTEREDQEIELPSDPQLLSFQVAASLELDAPVKQALQVIRSTSARLRQLATVLGPVADDAERRAAVRERARGNGRRGRRRRVDGAHAAQPHPRARPEEPDRGGGARRGERAALGRGGAPRPVLQPRSVESDRLHHRWQRGRKRGRAALPQVRGDGDPRARTGGRAGRRANRRPREPGRRAVG